MTWDVETADEARWAVWAEDGWDEGVAHCLTRLEGMPGIGDLLDLGAGMGRLAVPMARSRPDATVWAVDSSPSMLRYCAGPENLRAVQGDGETVPPLPDLAGAWSVLTSNTCRPTNSAATCWTWPACWYRGRR